MAASTTIDPPLLEARNLVKRFGDVVACDSVDISVSGGRIHALLGENGAGKSTLVKMLYGALQPDFGRILLRGDPVRVNSPSIARKLGIGMVYQHFTLFDALTAAENISLALPPELRLGDLDRRIRELSDDYGLLLQPGALVADLSMGERQRIEIVRCLLQEPRLLIMDEPTAVLAPREASALFETLRRLTGEGCAVLYISHRLDEVKKLCQDVTILRRGKVAARVDPRVETAASLARLMVGSEIHSVSGRGKAGPGETLIETNNLSLAAGTPFGVDLAGINIAVRAGEILAIAGVAGNGQGELFAALSGESPAGDPDAVAIRGKSCGRDGVTARRRLGAAFAPEERIGHGMVADFSLTENVYVTRHALSDNGGGALTTALNVINRDALSTINERICKKFDVRKSGADPEARSLSGGNMQKFAIGRELDRAPRVLVANQPTWGVDAGAAAGIRQALIDLARSGGALVVISQDLDEVFELADRIAVIFRGRLSRSYAADDISLEKIGLLMAGVAENKAGERAP